MRGLLRKDFYYMKDYRKVILIVVIFCGVFMAKMGEERGFWNGLCNASDVHGGA